MSKDNVCPECGKRYTKFEGELCVPCKIRGGEKDDKKNNITKHQEKF